MKPTTTIAAIALTALSFAAANTVLAQPGQGMGPGAGFGPGMTQGMGPGMGPGMRGRMAGPESLAAAQARLDDLKAALKITAAQESAWALYAHVQTQHAQSREAMRAQMLARMQDPALSQADRIAQRETMMKVRDVHMAERAEAIESLQAVLTPEQRAIADEALPMRGKRMAQRGMGRW